MAKNAWLSLALLLATGCGEERSAGISAEPAEVSFDPTFVGDVRVQRIEIAHTGTAGPLSVEAVDGPSCFTVAPAAFSIAPRGKQAVELTFRPEIEARVAGTIVFRASAGPSAEVAVDGVGAARKVRVAERLEFGSVLVHLTKTLPLTFTSDSSLPMEISITPPVDSAFAVSPATLRLEPGAEASVDVTFSPDWLDLVEETLSFRLCPGCDEMKIELAGSGLLL